MFNENKFSRFTEVLVYICILIVFLTSLAQAKYLNPIGLVIMFVGFISLLYSKLPNLRERNYFTFGVDQIKSGYRVFYSGGIILMIFGFFFLFYK